MAVTINGDGTIIGVSAGGLPTGSVTADTLATNSVDSAELVNGAIDSGHLASGVGGAWVYIASQTASASSSVDFTAIENATYTHHMVAFYDVLLATAGDLMIRIREAGGSAWIAANFNGGAFGLQGYGSAVVTNFSSNGTGIPINHTTLNTGTNQNAHGHAFLSRLNDTSNNRPGIWGTCKMESTGGRPGVSVFGGSNDNQDSDGYDGIRFISPAGNIVSGTFALYGLKES